MTATILNISPAHNGAGTTKYFFDVAFPNGMKVYRMRLVQTRNGTRVFGPRDTFGYSISLPIEVADDLAEIAKKEAVARYGRF